MAFQELLKVHSVKHVEQKAFDGGVSHRGFPGCVDCSTWSATDSFRAEIRVSDTYPSAIALFGVQTKSGGTSRPALHERGFN